MASAKSPVLSAKQRKKTVLPQIHVPYYGDYDIKNVYIYKARGYPLPQRDPFSRKGGYER